MYPCSRGVQGALTRCTGEDEVPHSDGDTVTTVFSFCGMLYLLAAYDERHLHHLLAVSRAST